MYEKAVRPTKIDELTQAYTRKYGMKLLNRMIQKNQKLKYTICFIDINHLKKINDDYGHDVGDKYLFAFCEGVRNANMRENVFSRIGGDEFLLVFKNLGIEESQVQLKILRSYLEKNKFKIDDKKKTITFAVGITTYPDEGNDIDMLIKLADKRMYIDKKNNQ